ncbi:tail protein X [Rhizobium tumorigenes]|uniref:tail protein X n=1 Tax=Rhizobium tumorigenes TaxID=2041385 RepID=UPI00241DE72C|nr:tail protein X [Rhizobium tumorigenes]WFS02761.1 tail protein X [Rhizobium tumorigenes]
MAGIYITKQGETVDIACQRFYGRTASTTEIVLAANNGLSALGPVLPMGTKITMPDVEKSVVAADLISLWS